MPEALGIIRQEHRRLAAVMQCVEAVVHDIEAGRGQPDFELLHAVLAYLETFLYAFHHPKEDQYLFPALRRRAAGIDATLDELEEQHSRGEVLLHGLTESLAVYEQRGAPALEDFAHALEAYHAFEWAHMRKEEVEVLRVAEQALQAEDWRELDAAFTAHDDPLFGDAPSAHFRRLFSEIANRTPAPHGLGPPAAGG